MARTKRNLIGMNRFALRKPKTYNEIKSLNKIIQDEDLNNYNLSKPNRITSRVSLLPTSWDDIVISGYLESDYKY